MNAFKIHKMLPLANLIFQNSPEGAYLQNHFEQAFRQWRVTQNGEQREKEKNEIQPRTIQFFQISSGEHPLFIFLLNSLWAVPVLYLNAWN